MWAMDLVHKPPRVSPRVRAQFGEIGADSTDALAATMGGRDHDLVRQRFAAGRRCFVAWVENKIEAYGWVSLRTEFIGELERDIHLQADEAYIWDCATLPAYRSQHLYSALLGHIVAALQEEGVRRAWIGAAVSNHASLRGFANAGFLPVITLTYTRLMNLRVLLLSAQHNAAHQLVVAVRSALVADDERIWGPLGLGWSRPASSVSRAQIKA